MDCLETELHTTVFLFWENAFWPENRRETQYIDWFLAEIHIPNVALLLLCYFSPLPLISTKINGKQPNPTALHGQVSKDLWDRELKLMTTASVGMFLFRITLLAGLQLLKWYGLWSMPRFRGPSLHSFNIFSWPGVVTIKTICMPCWATTKKRKPQTLEVLYFWTYAR